MARVTWAIIIFFYLVRLNIFKAFLVYHYYVCFHTTKLKRDNYINKNITMTLNYINLELKMIHMFYRISLLIDILVQSLKTIQHIFLVLVL